MTPEKFLSATSFIGNTKCNLSDAIENIWKRKKSEDIVIGAKIKGLYKDYIMMMFNKHSRKKRDLSGEVLVINRYDGAVHNQTKKGRTGIISFSSQMCSDKTIIDGASPAQSMNILTWQQMIGEENRTNLFPAIQKILEEIEKLKSDGFSDLPDTKFSYYELHDGKMLYLLTQHSLFNRKHFPFLLCTCGRGEGVLNENHKCQFVSHTK